MDRSSATTAGPRATSANSTSERASGLPGLLRRFGRGLFIIPGDDVDDEGARDCRNKHMKKALVRPPGAPGKKINVEKVNLGNIVAWGCLLARARATQMHDRLQTSTWSQASACSGVFLTGRTFWTLDYIIQNAGERGRALRLV